MRQARSSDPLGKPVGDVARSGLVKGGVHRRIELVTSRVKGLA
jgi:hypothetical protein